MISLLCEINKQRKELTGKGISALSAETITDYEKNTFHCWGRDAGEIRRRPISRRKRMDRLLMYIMYIIQFSVCRHDFSQAGRLNCYVAVLTGESLDFIYPRFVLQ